MENSAQHQNKRFGIETPAQEDISAYFENISILLLGILMLGFPLLFATFTTDFILLPKQIILAVVALITTLLLGAKMIAESKVRLRKTPFDMPLLIFAVVGLASVLLSVNMWDGLIAYIPFFLSLWVYFLLTNFVKTASSLRLVVSFLISGAVILSINAILSFFKIYILPFPFTQSQTFSPIGILLDQALYLGAILLVSVRYAMPILTDIKKSNPNILKDRLEEVLFGVASIVMVIGLGITIYELVMVQQPILLPFNVGFQTAFAAISQDTTRTIQSFLLGSGLGTYGSDFTRFKMLDFNSLQNLWTLTFFRSSSFVLELLATTGVLGLLSFLFIVFTLLKQAKNPQVVKTNPFFTSLIFIIVMAFVLPFSYITVTLFFFLLGLYAAFEGLKAVHGKGNKYFDMELYFVAFKRGIIAIAPTNNTWSTIPGFSEHSLKEEPDMAKNINTTTSRILPVAVFIVLLSFTGVIGFFSYQYVYADYLFQNSLVAFQANNGLETYNNQTNAIRIFPWKDSFYRDYSQVNLLLANSIASSQPQGASPSAQVQQTIYNLIQQSINSARQGAAVSPLTSANWQNLSSIYRSLIGFGQNAESFAVASMQQAIALDPNNPALYVNLGGIYYQLGQWDLAQNQFQLAAQLKPDYANAYYNLGHALEQKGDFENALAQYEIVKTLVASDKENLKKITAEIDALRAKTGTTAGAAKEGVEPSGNAESPLQISTPSAQLPSQKPPVKIPGPSTATSSAQ